MYIRKFTTEKQKNDEKWCAVHDLNEAENT